MKCDDNVCDTILFVVDDVFDLVAVFFILGMMIMVEILFPLLLMMLIMLLLFFYLLI